MSPIIRNLILSIFLFAVGVIPLFYRLESHFAGEISLQQNLSTGEARAFSFVADSGVPYLLTLSSASRQPGASPKSLNSCGTLSVPGQKYALEKDVSSPATCFSIQANNITLDLNGHKITYGMESRKTAAYGILGIACWDTTLSNGVANGNPCGGNFNRFTVLNGKILQAASVAAYSDALHLGQGGGNYLEVHDVEFWVQEDAAIPIYTTFSGAGARVYRNIIHNDVRTIPNRHQLQGMSVKFDNSQEIHPGQSVYANQIIGGTQGGIFLVTAGATAYGNRINQNSHYSNDFSIYVWGNDQKILNNEIDTVSGRGLQIGGGAIGTGGAGKGGAHSLIHDNRVLVTELKQNCDYSIGDACNVCEPGGAYGIQFDDNPQGDQSFNNTVVARANECDASALRITDSRLLENESHEDSFTGTRIGASAAKAYGWDNAGPSGFTARNDSFVGDSASYHVNWDGAQNEVCISCTVGKGTNPSATYVTFSFQNGGRNPVKNIHFVDTKFIGGAAKDSTDMRPLNASDWPGYSEYFIDWTFSLLVLEQNGNGLADADISFYDRFGNATFEGKTDGKGKISIPLTEFRMYNTPKQVVREVHTPYVVQITKQGCKGDPAKFLVDVKEPTSQSTRVTCGSK
jgi:hypothetical protein